jgi:uncharacterized membrane protein YqgA involved in biofilm formation
MFRTRNIILIVSIAGMIAAVTVENLAAIFVAVAAGAILQKLHTIEVKLNKLLDHNRIYVSPIDIEKG